MQSSKAVFKVLIASVFDLHATVYFLDIGSPVEFT